MGSSGRFAIGLFLWLGALIGAALLFAAAIVIGRDLAMVRLVLGLAVMVAAFGLWRHVSRTNRMLARFLEAMQQADWTARFAATGDAEFGALGKAMNGAMRAMQQTRGTIESELRFLEALVDDVPVALLMVDEEHGVRAINKAARRLFDRHDGVHASDFEIYGATFARLLAEPKAGNRELLILTIGGGLQRALVHVAALHRLSNRTNVIAVEPLQGTLDAIELAAQTDLVRVLTHEILNSLTPIMSLATTAEDLMDQDAPDLKGARLAISTLDRRTRGLLSFISAYRSVAHSPTPRPIRFEARPFAEELARLFSAEWPACQLMLDVADALSLTADPDLLAQAIINLLRNAGQATAPLNADAKIRLAMRSEAGHSLIEVEDNGPGIPEALVRDIFLPFFTTREEGSGVGLNLVRQIVVASGGSIDHSPAYPTGARFTIRLRA